MINLPKLKRDHEETQHLCRCRPVCKSRRREWKGETQKTSAELLLERKPPAECIRRWPMKVFPNHPCPLFGKGQNVVIQERGAPFNPEVVRICQAPVDDTVNTPYLKYAEIAKGLGALSAVKACCAFCECGPCCPCGVREYILHDAERQLRRQTDMRQYDARVKNDHQKMRIMYADNFV